MKNSTTEENRKAGRFGVRFSVLLLAAAMLITTPAYSFAAPTDGTGSDKPAAAGQMNESDDKGDDAAEKTSQDAQTDKGEKPEKGMPAENAGDGSSDSGAESDTPAEKPAGLNAPLLGATAVGPRTFGNGTVSWEITGAGELIIRPSDGRTSGRISKMNNGGTSPDTNNWPWLSYKNQIKAVSFEGTVGTEPDVDLNYMFSKLTNLKTADFRNFTQTNPGGSSPQTDTTRDMQGMFYGCTSLVEIKGVENLTSTRVRDLSRMFYNCKALRADSFKNSTGSVTKNVNETPHADFSWINTTNVETMREMFYGCGLGYVYMGNNTNDGRIRYMQDMFTGSGIVSFVLNNDRFRTGESAKKDGKYTGGSVQMQRMFGDCKSLRYIDMSNITIYGRDDDGWNQLNRMLMNNKNNNATPALETVKLKNTKVPNMRKLDRVFDGCTSLKTVDLSGFTPTDAVTMKNMFRNCTSLESLDVSSFGKLEHIVNMDGFVTGCTSLSTLNISNLDNSNIKPLRIDSQGENYHSAADEDAGAKAVNADWGRELGIDTCTSLVTIKAQASKVWMVKNTKGSASGGMYWTAENDSSIYYFTNNQMTLVPDSGSAVEIVTKRDYVDIMTDRQEIGERANGKEEWVTNKNMPAKTGSSVNKNGAGYLPAGEYTIKNAKLGDEKPPFQDSYYRITGISEKDPEVTFDTDKFMHIGKYDYEGQPHDSIDTKFMSGKEIKKLKGYTRSADKPLITVRYSGGAEDINGRTHDVVMEITKITFTDPEEIPEDPNRKHDENIYVYDSNYGYSRAVLEYDTGYVALKNYIVSNYDNRKYAMKSNSGMEIEFTISIEDALADTSVLFYLNDLDVMSAQVWDKGKDPHGKDDACYDTLGWGKVTYGEGSEGMKLQTGNDLDSLKFADHSGLVKIGDNYIVGSGHDPSTSWSSFSVRANAKQSKYTWTSGIGCTTEVLKETPPADGPDPVYVFPEATKLVNASTPKGKYKDLFEFDLTPASEVKTVDAKVYGREETLANMASQSDTGRKNYYSVVPFKELKFESPGTDGENEHAAAAYVYKIVEKSGTHEDVIRYNRTRVVRFMKFIVTDPQTDLEMERGTRADVALGEYRYEGDEPPETVDPDKIVWDAAGTRTVWSSDAQPTGDKVGEHTVFLDDSGKKFYRDGGKFLSYPDGQELSAARKEQTERKAAYPEGSQTTYPVLTDRDGVKYIKVREQGDVHYLDPDNNFKQLRVTREGDVYPEAGDKASAAEKKSATGEIVRVDVHGKEYYLKGGKYYDTSDNELTVKDGVFNPDESYDRTVYDEEKHNGHTIYEDEEGTRYYYTGSGDSRRYFDLNDRPLTVGVKGDVSPSKKDAADTCDRKDEQFLVVKGHTVYRDKHGIRYYKSGTKYYDVLGTILTVEEGVFEPDSDRDEEVKLSFDIMEEEIDGKTVKFYKSDGRYYVYKENGDFSDPVPFEFPKHLLDTSEAVNAGIFNNTIKTSKIKIVNKTLDGKAGDFTFYIRFDDGFNPTDFEFSPVRPQAGQFDRVTSGKYKGCYKFTLSEGQAVVINKVPLHTTYTVTEPVEANGWELVKIEDGDTGGPGNSTGANRSVTREIKTDSIADYTHTFTNRFTELITDKTIRVKTGEETDTKKVFEFTAEITVNGLEEGEEFTYGWVQEAENQKFYKSEADSSSETVSMSFKLRHGEDIALVVPQGANVSVTEAESSYLSSTRTDNSSGQGTETEIGTRAAEASNVSNSDKYELHFFNQLVTPVGYDKIRVEKVIQDHAWMSGYSFEMALIPMGYLDNNDKVVPTDVHTPLPAKTQEYDTGKYSPKFVQKKHGQEISDLPEDQVGYWAMFDEISFTNDDMVILEEGKWKQTESKTFVYQIRELTPQESSAQDPAYAPGLTYSTEIYEVDISVHLDKAGSKLELVVDGQKIYRIDPQDGSREVVSAARFINKFDPNEKTYRMAADKVLTSNRDSVTLKDGAYSFELRPVGEFADIAPMPKKTQGTGGNRFLRVDNVYQMVRFLDYTDPDDGLSFKLDDLIGSGLTKEQLKKGVVFEYEMNEIIPEAKSGETKKNNDDGTWTIVDADGNMQVFDGIYHVRALEVKLVTERDETTSEEKEVISVSNHKGDHTKDGYIDKNGARQSVSKLKDYDPAEHHTLGGAPIFHNLYIEEGHAPIVLKKNWSDHDNMDRIRPDKVRVTVKSDDPDAEDRTVTLEQSKGWTVTVEDLPIYSHNYDRTTGELDKITYSFEEVREGHMTGNEKTGYKASYAPESVTLDEDSEKDVEVLITNRHIPADGKAEDAETWGLRGQTQTGEPDYNVVPHNPVTPKELAPAKKEGSTISDDKKTVTIPGEGRYTLNDDGTVTFVPETNFLGDPEPITIKCLDRLEKAVNVQYTPHVTEPVDKDNATRTIHFTRLIRHGEKVVDDVVQTVTLVRKAVEVDPKTGDVRKWGEWSKAVFPAVPNPDSAAGEGWYTNDKAGELTVDKPGKVQDVHVVYHIKEYTVTFTDGEHGKSSGGSVKKKYGETPQSNTVKPEQGWTFIGIYEYVITDENGKIIDRGRTKDPSSIKVTGNIVFTPIYEADPNGGGSHRGSGTDTGDSNALIPLTCMTGVCLAALIALIAMRRRRRG